jgi:hypothetical protein
MIRKSFHGCKPYLSSSTDERWFKYSVGKRVPKNKCHFSIRTHPEQWNLQNRNAAPKVKKAVPEEKVASLVTSFGAAGTDTLGWNGGISGSPPNMSFRTHLRIWRNNYGNSKTVISGCTLSKLTHTGRKKSANFSCTYRERAWGSSDGLKRKPIWKHNLMQK